MNTTNDIKVNASFAVIMRGDIDELRDFCDFLNDRKPEHLHVVYTKLSPGKLWVKEGERE